MKQLELNKRYTWQELAESLPDSWVFLTDAVKDKGGNIVEAELLGYCEYGETFVKETLDKVMALNKEFTFHRTTPESFTIDIQC